MSSFIVNDECMNNIINGLFWNHEFKNFYRSILEEAGYNESEDFKRLATDLFNLNYDAVDCRYGEKRDRADIKNFVWINPETNLCEFQVLKSMHCLRYQCSEGNIPNKKLFKLLNELINAWANFIIDKTKEYQEAKWG